MQKSNNNFFKRFFFFILLIVLTPVLIIEGIVSAAKKSKRKKEWKKFELEGQQLLLTKGITDIDLMEGYMFEDYLRILLFYLGFKVSQTQKSRDYGADLILIDPQTNKKIIVQAKRYSKPVGSKAVQEIATAQIHYKSDEAWVITNNIFTPQAEQLAKENNVRLIDRNELIEMYQSVANDLQRERQDGLLLNKSSSFQEKYPYYI